MHPEATSGAFTWHPYLFTHFEVERQPYHDALCPSFSPTYSFLPSIYILTHSLIIPSHSHLYTFPTTDQTLLTHGSKKANESSSPWRITSEFTPNSQVPGCCNIWGCVSSSGRVDLNRDSASPCYCHSCSSFVQPSLGPSWNNGVLGDCWFLVFWHVRGGSYLVVVVDIQLCRRKTSTRVRPLGLCKVKNCKQG